MDFSGLTAYLDGMKERHVPGCDLIIYKDHREVYRHFAGTSDYDGLVPMNGKETCWLYSATKVFTNTCALQLIERGQLGLDDPVDRYLPEYAVLNVRDGDTVRPAKTRLTVRHLMSMQGGLNYDLWAPSLRRARELYAAGGSTRAIIANLSHEPLGYDPGTSFEYSLCHDVLAAVIEVASGMRFSDYMAKNVFEPLGIRHMGFRAEGYLAEHMSASYTYDEEKGISCPTDNMTCDYMLCPGYESGGAGLIGSVEDYILLMDALAMRGEAANGNRILKPETVELFHTPQLCEAGRKVFDSWERKGYTYALGVRTMENTAFGRSPVGEFGWDGAAGVFALADPVNGLSLFYGQHVRGMGFIYTECHPVIRDLTYEAMGL